MLTEAKSNIVIAVLLVMALMTTVFQTYISRSCVALCDMFYAERAEERAEKAEEG